MRFKAIDVPRSISEMVRIGVVSVPDFLTDTTRKSLLHNLSTYEFEKEPEEKGEFRVQQHFSARTEFFPGGRIWNFAKELDGYLGQVFEETLSTSLSFTNLMAIRYQPGLVGISSHRDGKSFINIVAVLVLEGDARFCVCSDRYGNNACEIENPPGSLLLMRAPGFLGEDVQPFHFVDHVRSTRTTLAFRQKKL